MNVSAGTIARTLCLGLALTNQILSATGHQVLPIEDEQINTLVTTGLTVAASLWSWWKNSSFTKPALTADVVMNAMRNGTVTEDDVVKIISKK